MPRRRLPNPSRRNGALTWEVRCRIGGKVVSRSLGTRDYDEALKRVPKVYAEVLREIEAPAPAQTPLGGKLPSTPASFTLEAKPPATATLRVSDACRMYRDYHLECERQHRLEYAAGGIEDPAKLAATYRARLNLQLKTYHAKAVVHDFRHPEWFLTYLSNSGVGDVDDRSGALMALSRTSVATIREIIEHDLVLPVEDPPLAAQPKLHPVPVLSKVSEQFIAERGSRMTAEVAGDHRAIVRDLCAVVGDKPITDYGRNDARAFKEVLLDLPANWMKRVPLRGLAIVEAAKKAKELGLPRQTAKSIQLKRATLRGLFTYAAANFDGVSNPFEDRAAWVVADETASDQRDTFSPSELEALLASPLRGNLYWMTWLGLCTGARLNELCQLTTDLVLTGPVPHIYFSPELRLKTCRKQSCVRKVPLHPKLLSLNFLRYAKSCEKNPGKLLFPGLPKHRTGRYSDAPSKAFRRHLKLLGIKRPKLSFHSLRHNFAAEFKRNAPTEFETRERLMGHHVPGVAGRYGDSYAAEANDLALLAHRASVVDRLDF